MVARYALVTVGFLSFGTSSVFGSTTPKVLLEKWKDIFAANPKYFEVGVHAVEKPEKAFVVTGSVSRQNLSLKTLLEREIAADLAELAAKKQLLNYMYRFDKGKLKLPRHLEQLATESLKFDAHSRTLTMRGVQVAARWTDEKHVWCTLVIAQSNVQQIREFADSFRIVGANHYLGQFTKNRKDADLYRAAEIGGLEAKQIREALSQRMLAHGFHVAAFVVHSPSSRLPGPDDQLASFLLKAMNPAWDEAMAQFEAEKPNLDKALNLFLAALETRYADPDALNYVGVCFKELGYPRMGSVFFQHTLAQSNKQQHRFALTNLGLCLVELDQLESGRGYLQKAVEAFPKEMWTEKARQMLRKLDAEKNR